MPLGGDWWNPASAAGGPPAPARSLDFTQPGAGLQNAGIDSRDMYPRFEKLRGLKDQKEGGNAQLWKNLDRWENTPQGANVDPQQKQLFDLYHRTGKRDPGLKDETVAAALDWGVREGTRSQVHKERFMDSTLGKLLQIPITAAGYYVGGPLGAGIANGLYQGVGNKDILSGVKGFASGYAGGSLGGKLTGFSGNMAGLPGGGTFSGLIPKGGPLSNILPSGGSSVGSVGSSVSGPLRTVRYGTKVAGALRGRKARRSRSSTGFEP